MKTILITGTTGYLGTRLACHFLQKNYKIIALYLNENEKFHCSLEYSKNVKRYYLNKSSIKNIFDENKIDIVIHTATLYGRNNENINTMIQSNLLFPLEVLYEASVKNTEIFINTDTMLNRNTNVYSLTKSQFSDWLEMFCEKIKCVNMRLEHFYGPEDKPVKFIAWIIEQFRKNVDSIDLTAGLQKRDFIYIDDVISAFDCVVKNQDKHILGKVNKFDVASGTRISIRELVTQIQNMMGNTKTKLNFGALPYRKEELLEYETDISGLKSLGWEPKVFTKEGLEKVCNK